MRAYFRVFPRFGVSMPWWLAPFAYLLWLSIALAYYIIGVIVLFTVWVSLWLAAQAQDAWLRRKARRA